MKKEVVERADLKVLEASKMEDRILLVFSHCCLKKIQQCISDNSCYEVFQMKKIKDRIV